MKKTIFNENLSWYKKAGKLVKDVVTKEEYWAYKNGDIEYPYGSFDFLLYEHKEKFNQIIQFVIFIKTLKLIQNNMLVKDYITDNIEPDEYDLTPTRISIFINLKPDTGYRLLNILFPQMQFVMGDTFSSRYLDIIESIKWFDVFSFLITSIMKEPSFTLALQHNITSDKELDQILAIKPQKTDERINQKFLEDAYFKITKLNEWQRKIYESFQEHLGDDVCIYVGDGFVRAFKTSYDALMHIDMTKDFKYDIKTFRGKSKKLIEVTLKQEELLEEWYKFIKKTKLGLFTSTLENLCCRFLKTYDLAITSYKYAGTHKLYSNITIEKHFSYYSIVNHDYNGNQLMQSRKIGNAESYEQIAKILVSEGYYVYSHNLSKTKSLAQDLYINAAFSPIVDDIIDQFSEKNIIGIIDTLREESKNKCRKTKNDWILEEGNKLFEKV